MIRALSVLTLLLFVGVANAATNDTSPEDQAEAQAARIQEQLDAMSAAARARAIDEWMKPAAHVLPVLYWEHIGTLEDQFVTVALCGGAQASCVSAEEKLREFSEACLLRMVLVDLDLFDWSQTFDYGDGGPKRSIPIPATIYKVADPSFVLLERPVLEGGQLGYFEPVVFEEVTREKVTEVVCPESAE